MPETYDLIVRGGEVVNHAGSGVADVGVRDGKIAVVGDLSRDSAGEEFDARGLTVLPGVIDSQVHFREPGLEWKEDLETGSRAAVLGGVTAVFEMPNTNPLTTSEATLADKIRRATGRMHCDFLPAFDLFALSSDSEGLPVALLEAMACALPAVVTAVGAVPQVVDEGRAGLLVPPRDPASLACALASLIADPALRAALGARGLRRVSERYSAERMASEYEAVYRRLLASRSAGRAAR